MIKECIIVKDEAGDLSSADDSDGRKAKRRVKTHRKGKRVAKPFVLDSLGYRPEVGGYYWSHEQVRSEEKWKRSH